MRVAGTICLLAIAVEGQTGKLAFDVASVKPSQPGGFFPPNFPMDAGDAFTSGRTGEPPRGRFSAVFPLASFISFAYKLSPDERRTMAKQLPKWAEESYEIQARAAGNPTKDEMRLMMQSLLAERFQFAAHFETQEGPVFALALVKPGKLGPQLRPHGDGPPCDTPPNADLFPPRCDVYSMRTKQGGGESLWGSRNTTMELMAGAIPSLENFGRPVVDETGLTGRFDVRLEFTPDPSSMSGGNVRLVSKGGGGAPLNNPIAAPPTPPSDSAGPSLTAALREQLGLKLVSTRGKIRTLVVDRVERPSAN